MPIVDFELKTEHVDQIIELIKRDLSEPYTIYTYRYFLHQWTNLCFLYTRDDELEEEVSSAGQATKRNDQVIGVIICRLELHKGRNNDDRMRGYIGMLAVDKTFRGKGIGRKLAIRAIEKLKEEGADEVVLETEKTNVAALRLYERLGFVRDKRLPRYYMSGVDAFRLKLWFK